MTDAKAIAETVARWMYDRDNTARAHGVELLEIGPGHARMRMVVRDDMLNSHGTLHGGMSFMLADTAFAYACNSYNHVTVAAGCDIVYPAAARAGDVLEAVAVERLLSGRNGVYDVTITSQTGAIIALFRGRSRRLAGQVAPLAQDGSDRIMSAGDYPI